MESVPGHPTVVANDQLTSSAHALDEFFDEFRVCCVPSMPQSDFQLFEGLWVGLFGTTLDVRPEVLDRVQIRRVGWPIDHINPGLAYPLLNDARGMFGVIILWGE